MVAGVLAFLCLWGCLGGHRDVAEESPADILEPVDTIPAPREVSIVWAGDAMQHRAQLARALRPDGTYDYSGCFSGVADYVARADYAVVNLETTLGVDDFTGYPRFCSPRAYADELKRAGFDLFLTANNHCLDRRDAGAVATLDWLDSLGVTHIGTYRNRAERDSVLPCVVDIGGIKVGFLNYTYGTNGLRVERDVVADYINRDKIGHDIEATRSAGAEIMAVAMHWGDEYHLLPNDVQRALADFLVEQGVGLVIGGHPHVVQPMEMRHGDKGDALVVYSLGNFISGMRTTDTRGGVMVKTWLRRDGDGTVSVAGAEYLPVFTVPGDSRDPNFHLVVADSCNDPRAKAFLKNAYGIFDAHNRGVARSRSF